MDFCLFCGVAFTKKTINQKYCCVKHNRSHISQKYRAKNKAKIQSRNKEYKIANKRKVYEWNKKCSERRLLVLKETGYFRSVEYKNKINKYRRATYDRDKEIARYYFKTRKIEPSFLLFFKELQQFKRELKNA